MTLLIIGLGVFNVITFFSTKFGLSLNSSEIDFDILLLFIGILHFIINYKYFGIQTLTKTQKVKLVKFNNEDKLNKIELFKKRYSDKSSNELENIILNNDFLPEAISAAKELLESKKK